MSRIPPEAKTIAVVAYLTIVGALISMTMNAEPRHEFGRFHTRQAFGLHISFIGSALFISLFFELFTQAGLLVFTSVWIGLYVSYFVLWLYGFTAALRGREQLVPLLGSHFQRWFSFIP